MYEDSSGISGNFDDLGKSLNEIDEGHGHGTSGPLGHSRIWRGLGKELRQIKIVRFLSVLQSDV